MSHENKLTIKEAARLTGMSEQFIRIALQQGKLPWGCAVRMSGRNYTYFISKQKFIEHTGISVL